MSLMIAEFAQSGNETVLMISYSIRQESSNFPIGAVRVTSSVGSTIKSVANGSSQGTFLALRNSPLVVNIGRLHSRSPSQMRASTRGRNEFPGREDFNLKIRRNLLRIH